ncbi:MAG: M14 family metallopeptidase [Pirellulales bacterium]
MTNKQSWRRRLAAATNWLCLLAAVILFTSAAGRRSHGENPRQAAPTPAERYAAAGGPANPQVDVRWNRYRDYAEATELLKQLAEAYPQLCKLQSVGKSYGKRDLWVMTITNFESGPANHKPAMWIDGGIHANEIQSVEVVLYTAWYLLEMADQSEAIAELLDTRTFYLCPMLSPDARDAHFYQPNTTHTPRTGLQPVDDDRDGLVDEDGPDDLNGDGHITQMRVRDPNGTHKPHDKYPNVMVRVENGERGEYRLLGEEGIDNDADGKVNEDGDGSYDPNRDWPWMWQPRYVQRGAHRYPLSIKENRLVAEFIMKQKNIIGGQSYHNAGGMLLRGPGAKSDRFEREDIEVYDRLGKQGAEILPGYRYLNIANDLYEVHGGSIDWLHQMHGAYTFTNEMFTPFNFFRQHSEGGFFGSVDDQQRFNKYLLLSDATVPWEEVEHPTYGKIEVGGMKKNWLRQPPAFLIEEELHRNMAFTLYHASELPQVEIASVDVRDLGDGLKEVTAAIRNNKLTPTHSRADLKHRITRPDWVTLGVAEFAKNSEENVAEFPKNSEENVAEFAKNSEAPENGRPKVLLGMWSDEPFFISPKEQKRMPQRMEIPRVDGHAVVYVRWIVQGEGPFTVEFDSVKGGRAEKDLAAIR